MTKKITSLEEVTGNFSLEVPQCFIAVLISPDPTFHKTNGCQGGTLKPFEKNPIWPPKSTQICPTPFAGINCMSRANSLSNVKELFLHFYLK